MTDELKALFAKINSTADFGYVDFAEVNATNCLGENALHICVRWGDIDAVRLLVASGADVNKHGEHGYTPLHYACEKGNEEIVKLLLDSGANPFARTEGDIPFTTARMHGNDAVCDMLSPYMRESPHRPQATPEGHHDAALTKHIEILEESLREHCEKDV